MVSRQAWARYETDLRALVGGYHAAHPLRTGMPREELKSRLAQRPEAARRAAITTRAFNALMTYATASGVLAAAGSTVRLAEHSVQFTADERARVSALLADFEREPYNTPAFKVCAAQLGNDLLTALLEQGQLVQVSAEVLFLSTTYAEMAQAIGQILTANGKITVAEVRDRFKTSRKYALALMEYLDATGVTLRVGDERVLRHAAPDTLRGRN